MRWLTAPFRWFAGLIAAPKFFRRIVLLWCLCAMSYILYQVFKEGLLAVIQTPGASVVIAMLGMLATITGFYIQLRHIDERQGHE